MSAWENIGKTDEWYTPKYVFDAMGALFDLDVAAPKDRAYCHVPAKNFITELSLTSEWNGFVWMNPPFGGRNGIVPWLDKFFLHANGIALAPDRTSAPWCQKAIRKCEGFLLVDGKIKFIKPDGTTGNSPSTGTILFASGDKAIEHLKIADKNGLGVFTQRYHND